MSQMKNCVIVEIKKFIESENGLLGDEWKDNYFASSGNKSIHVSEVKFRSLSSDDMLRFLMYLLLERDRASNYRIKNAEWKKIK